MLKYGEKAPEPYSNYIVASLGYENKNDAYTEIKNFYKGEEATTFFDIETNKWHIILKQAKEVQ